MTEKIKMCKQRDFLKCRNLFAALRICLIESYHVSSVKFIPGSINGYWEVEYPIAVFLQFQSVENPKFQDFFYYKNPRERIFQFRNYRPKTLYNRANPVRFRY